MLYDVAKQFSNEKGLIWKIKPSYYNPLKLVIGIEMDWVSAFKNEAEVLYVANENNF